MTTASQEFGVVPVGLGPRAYEVRVGPALLAGAGQAIRPFAPTGRVFVLADATVWRLHGEALAASLAAAGLKAVVLPVEGGEQAKSWSNIGALLDSILAHRLERRDLILAFGGGVIGDLAGFAAAVALRGIDFVQIPTTLLAQVDSSVGGKTGVNMAAGKNLAGAFHQPRLVLADTAILDTLPRRELLAGYAEVVKYGALGDEPFFAWLEANGADVLDGAGPKRSHAILESVRAKAMIVEEDERETGRRALLNLGHTFGHALESAVGYDGRLLHGEAVGIGMVMALDLSVMLGLAPAEDADRLRRHLASVGLPSSPLDVEGQAWDAQDLVDRMGSDKKVRDGRLTFILAHGMGKAFVTQDVDRQSVLASVQEALTA